MIYGYCRISTRRQSVERQIRNIKNVYPEAIIIQETYTGRSMNRPKWNNLYNKVKSGDIIVFDSVCRMSRNAIEGTQTYFELYDRGVQLIFLNERCIDTAIYAESRNDKLQLYGTEEDEIFKGLNNYFRKVAEKQIRIAFEHTEKEVNDISKRTKEGIAIAKLNGKQIGTPKGTHFTTKKSIAAKKIILKNSKDFNGSNTDEEVMKIAGISRNSYYKYKRELKETTNYE
jgi:DNA invertase Pin-like site-specific DNA recombinase